MYKKFLLMFYVGIMLCGLNTPGQTAQYTDAFEWEVTHNRCRNLTCNVVNKGGETIGYRTEYHFDASYVAGYSSGPSRVTTHYVDIPSKESQVPIKSFDNFECSLCGSGYPFRSSSPPPKVEIRQKGNTRIMTLNFYPDSVEASLWAHPCRKPELSGNLEVIFNESKKYADSWAKSLEYMWETARRLDMKDKEVPYQSFDCSLEDHLLPLKPEITHMVKTSSSCCNVM